MDFTTVPPLSSAAFETLEEHAYDPKNYSTFEVRKETADKIIALTDYVQLLQKAIVELQNHLSS